MCVCVCCHRFYLLSTDNFPVAPFSHSSHLPSAAPFLVDIFRLDINVNANSHKHTDILNPKTTPDGPGTEAKVETECWDYGDVHRLHGFQPLE